MESPLITAPQKTSFWDFWHKKNYLSKREKIIDFLAGFFCGILILPVSSISIPVLYLIILRITDINFFEILGFIGVFSIYLPGILLIIYLLLKRKYMFAGMLIGYLIMFLLGLFSLGSF